ncbi:MAG: DUF21 domain-containing protein, partial [Ignavibacteria bacterium]|nr:DUF21 domain-containing protein [Ignavibacteria bacterium]
HIFRPFIVLLNSTANKILNLVGIKPATESERSHSEEEIRSIIADETKSGQIDETEHAIIQKVFGFNDKTASDVMVPRNNMI